MIKYDYSQPYITRDEYLEVKGIDLNIELQDDDNSSNKVNRFIQDITNFVLDHLVMEYNCNELNRQTHNFEDLAEFRRVRFHYGMLEEIEYVLNNGLIQLDSGINRETGTITDFSGLVIGSSALKQFRLGGFCNKQEGSCRRSDLSPREMPTIEELLLLVSRKVDKVDGKGLSANDYTTSDKTLLKSVAQDLNNKVDKEEGKKLTTNDFDNAYKEKLDGIESGAQENKIEEIRVNNEPLTITGKAVNIPSYTYNAGTGIEITDFTISIDEDVVATKSEIQNLATKTELQTYEDSNDDRVGRVENRVSTVEDDVVYLDNKVNINKDNIDSIQSLIPAQASSSNKLADKDFVNSTVNSLSAFYICKNAAGDPFDTKAQLLATTTFYSGGVVRIPTQNDYCLVNADETHDGAACRYIYQGQYPSGVWQFQFKVNDTPFTADQITAINSGITSGLVSSYNSHIANKNNPHEVTKAQVGLSNVDNTSDADKPISNATLSELNKKSNATNLENGTGVGALKQKIVVSNNDISGTATGRGAILFGGKRIDKVNNDGTETEELTPSTAEGDMSFAQGGDVHATGLYAVVFHKGNTASGRSSAVIGGEGNTASGQNSFVQGEVNQASGRGASASGTHTNAQGDYSHVEGYYNTTTSTAKRTHVEGQNNTVSAEGSHVEGILNTSVAGKNHHVEGQGNVVSGEQHHVEGANNTVSDKYSHVEGANNVSLGQLAHVEGQNNVNHSLLSHTEGSENLNEGIAAHSEGGHNEAWGIWSHTEGLDTQTGRNTSPFNRATIDVSPTPPEPEPTGTKYVLKDTITLQGFPVSSGIKFQIKGNNTVFKCIAVGGSNMNYQEEGTWSGGVSIQVHTANGWVNSNYKTIYVQETTEAFTTWLNANKKENEPVVTIYPGSNHAEGYKTRATGKQAHVEGSCNIASGTASHAEGYLTEANGAMSHASGKYTTANGYAQTVVGKYNNPSAPNSFDSLFQVGNGTDKDHLSNAFDVYADGHAEVKTMGNTDHSVTTRKYVNNGLNTLQQEINNLKNIGRFLSIWNASTGVAETNPPESPYTYKVGDYFRIGTGGNRIPTGTTYTIGGTNYTTTTTPLALGDLVYYDGTVWQRQAKGQGGDVYDVQANGVSVVSGGIANITKANLGLGNIDNTSDLNKPVSTAQQTAIDNSKIYNNSNPTTVAVGGIPKNSTFSNKTIQEVLDMLFYPEIPLGNLSVSSNQSSGSFEYGTSRTISTVTPTFTVGSYPITSFKIGTTSGGSNIYDGTATSGTAITLSSPITWSGQNTYTLYCTLTDGHTTKTASLTYSPTYSSYYKVDSSTTTPTSSLTRDNAVDSSSGTSITYAAGDYIYIYSHSKSGSSHKIQTNVFGQWADVSVGTTYIGSVNITNSAGVSVSYYAYRTTSPMAGAGSGTFRLN